MASKNPRRLYEQALAFHQRGQLAQAVEQYRAFLKLVPEAAEVHSNMGAALATMSQFQSAAQCFQRALKLKPDFAQAHFNLGNALKGLGRLDDALRSLHRAVELEPRHVLANYELGSTYLKQGRAELAKHWLQQGLRLQADNPHILNALGLVMRDEKKPEQALDLFKQALRSTPGYAEAYFNMGLVHQDDGNWPEACEAFYSAIKIQPENTDALISMAKCLNDGRQFDDAIEMLERLLILSPKMLRAHIQYSKALTGLHRIDEALLWAQKALEIDGNDEDAQLNLIRVLQEKGEHALAEQRIAEFLIKKPGNPVLCLLLSASKKFSSADQALITLLQNQLQSPELSDDDRKELHFALGKISDDIKNHPQAFQHYAAAHQIKRASSNYEAQQNTDRINLLMQVFSAEYFAQHTGIGNASELPVFVVGMPRSGTTLTEQIIASHPQAAGAGEVPFFSNAIDALPLDLNSSLPYPQCVDDLNSEVCGKVAARYLQIVKNLAGNSEAKRIVDKMPHNFLELGLIATVFPKARIIHIKRDAMDNCLSIYFQNFSGHEYAHDLRDLGRHYLDYERLMRHWKAVLPLPVLEVSYETLVQNQEQVSRQIIDFIGLPWHIDCLTPHKTEKVVKTASIWQVRQPVYQTSVARWKNYEPWLGPLKETLGID